MVENLFATTSAISLCGWNPAPSAISLLGGILHKARGHRYLNNKKQEIYNFVDIENRIIFVWWSRLEKTKNKNKKQLQPEMS